MHSLNVSQLKYGIETGSLLFDVLTAFPKTYLEKPID
jgi:hypothetical protein